MSTATHTLFERLFSLTDKTVLVTGASGGIGRVLARAFAAAGATVALHGRKHEELSSILTEIVASGGQATIHIDDLADLSACQRLVNSVCAAHGRLDVLVNCAGMNRRKPIAEVTPDDFDTIVAVNLRSVFFLCQSTHPILKAQGGGRIINIGSATSSSGLGDVSVYGITKSALANFTKTMAVEWARDGILINCLAPGFMMTPLTEKALWGDPVRNQWLTERIPLRRPGLPEELVGMALLLASEAGSYITGQLINVDGGYNIGGWWKEE